MSEIWLPREPAHFELRPYEPKWYKADNKTASLIANFTECDAGAVIEQMSSSLSSPLGYYRVQQYVPLFVKVIPSSLINQQLYADKVASFLCEYDVNVNRLLPSFPRFSVDTEFAVLAYPLVKGRFLNFTVKDMIVIGSEIGKMHKYLRACPWEKEIEVKGRERAQTLENLLCDIGTGAIKVDIPEGAAKILESANIADLKLLAVDPQVIHGDLNYGNIMIQKDTGRAIIFDFEDVVTAWFNPYMELAFVIERFALTPVDEQSLELSNALISSYFKMCGRESQGDFQLSSLLRGLSIRALLLLTKSSLSGAVICDSEWKKFLMLYEQSRKWAGLFDKISKLIHIEK